VNRELFEALLAHPGLPAAPPSMDPVAAKRFEELHASREELHAERTLEDSIARLRLEGIERRALELDQRLEAVTDPEERQRLNLEKLRLARERNEIGSNQSNWARKVKVLGRETR
jgi:hypothetical protein